MGINEASLKQHDKALAIEILLAALSLTGPKEKILALKPEMTF